MKLQFEDGIIELLALPREEVRLTIADSISLTHRDIRVLIAALEALSEDV